LPAIGDKESISTLKVSPSYTLITFETTTVPYCGFEKANKGMDINKTSKYFII
jgi:hypothetical protein